MFRLDAIQTIPKSTPMATIPSVTAAATVTDMLIDEVGVIRSRVIDEVGVIQS